MTLLKELQEQLPLDGHLAGESTLCHNIEEVKDAIERYGEAMLKQPWSSSGRGIKKVNSKVKSQKSKLSSLTANDGWINRILKSQGSVVVEKKLNKIADFALEFWLDGKRGVEYRGLSFF